MVAAARVVGRGKDRGRVVVIRGEIKAKIIKGREEVATAGEDRVRIATAACWRSFTFLLYYYK